MKEFMRQKERSLAIEEHKGDLDANEEERLKKKVTKNAWLIAKEKVSQNVNQERINVYEEAFSKIQVRELEDWWD
jgi:hypothetical protein